MTAPTAERIREIRQASERPRFRAGTYDVRDLLAALDHVAERLWYCWQEEEYAEVPELLAYLGKDDAE